MAILVCIASSIALYAIPKEALAILQFGTLPLSLSSKLPQIIQNAKTQSTGQLSAFAVFSQIAGCLARLFTTATEVGDLLVTAGFALALLLNCILGVQMWMFWGKDEREKDSAMGQVPFDVPREKGQAESVHPQVAQSSIVTTSTQQPSGRRWARKID